MKEHRSVKVLTENINMKNKYTSQNSTIKAIRSQILLRLQNSSYLPSLFLLPHLSINCPLLVKKINSYVNLLFISNVYIQTEEEGKGRGGGEGGGEGEGNA